MTAERLHTKCQQCHLFVEENSDAGPDTAAWLHLYGECELCEETNSSHSAEPGPSAPLEFWEQFGPRLMRARFVKSPAWPTLAGSDPCTNPVFAAFLAEFPDTAPVDSPNFVLSWATQFLGADWQEKFPARVTAEHIDGARRGVGHIYRTGLILRADREGTPVGD
ncbi:hypothetical protein ACFVAJ_17555 [Agromyces sp. NPDC057679]|uniref:hypothetical protein n=1 Tax=Agromyces sp. NPDC057679 TaxID=3346207 RepID=UPI0036711504